MNDASLLPDAAAGAGLLLAAVYGTSGLTKLREVQSTESAFHQLRLPHWMVRMQGPRLLGPGEVVLALALLLLPTPWYAAAAVASLLLGVVYTVLVVRALGFDVPVTCGCFGKLGQGTITRATVVRNLVLVALGLVTVVDAVRGGSIVGRLLDGPSLWWWIPVLAAGVALTWLIGGGADGRPATGPETQAAGAHDAQAPVDTAEGGALEGVEELDYLRTPIPFVQVTGDDGPLRLREISQGKAWLVLWVSLGCGSCMEALARAEEFAREFEHVGVLVVTTTPSAPDDPLRPSGVTVAYDEGQQMRLMFALQATPSALLLGADGLMAGGPVAGGVAVTTFIEDVATELREAAGRAQDPTAG